MVELRSYLSLGWTTKYTEDGEIHYVDPEGNSFWDVHVGTRSEWQQQEYELGPDSLSPVWIQAFDKERRGLLRSVPVGEMQKIRREFTRP